jgi:hypothetical protein
MIVFHDQVQSKVAPSDPDDLVRLQDIGAVGGVIEILTALGFLIQWDNGDTTWDVPWRE